MRYAFRKRDILLIIGIVVFSLCVFSLGFFLGARSGIFPGEHMGDNSLRNTSTGDSTELHEGSGDSDESIESGDSSSSGNTNDEARGSLDDESSTGNDANDASAPGLPNQTEEGNDLDNPMLSPEEPEEMHSISWQFVAYMQPDFEATKIGSFEPQSVRIIEKLGSGWALVEFDNKNSWVYIEKNIYYIDRWLSLYSSYGNDNADSAISPQLVEVLEQRADWIRISTMDGDKWVNTAELFRQSVLLSIPALDQRELGYPLGCEMVALTMLMNYVTDVSVHTLVDEMPRADHPDQGFRGEPSSSTRGWTIFPPALEDMMVRHIGTYFDMSGYGMTELQAQLNRNAPVMVWVKGLGWAVHSLCLTGYDKNGFYYNDPWTGVGNTFITYNDFYAIWNEPITDGVLGLTYDPRKAMSYFA